MTKATANEIFAEERDLETADIRSLCGGETPRQIWGFSQYLNKEDKVFYYQNKRDIIDPFNTSPIALRREVKNLIDTLRPSHVKTESLCLQDESQIIKTLAEIAEKRRAARKVGNDSSESVSYCINGVEQPDPYIFEINKPTLFIFSTNYERAQFTGNYIIPKEPSTRLPSHCSNNVYLLRNKTVMTWFSNYNGEPQRTTAWFDLVVNGLETESKKMLNLIGLMDPGIDPP